VTIRRFNKLSLSEQEARIKGLMSENRRLQNLVTKLEVTNISLKNENLALKKNIEARANDKFREMFSQIVERANKPPVHSESSSDERHS
jgi:hypothetical protein